MTIQLEITKENDNFVFTDNKNSNQLINKELFNLSMDKNGTIKTIKKNLIVNDSELENIEKEITKKGYQYYRENYDNFLKMKKEIGEKKYEKINVSGDENIIIAEIKYKKESIYIRYNLKRTKLFGYKILYWYQKENCVYKIKIEDDDKVIKKEIEMLKKIPNLRLKILFNQKE